MSRLKSSRSGFTILELALSMAFLSFLLLAIGIVTIQLMHIYQRGITMKSVNSTGRELVDEFTRTISGTHYAAPDDDSSFDQEIYHQSSADILKDAGGSQVVPTNGAFCAGNYSYIWNTGYVFKLDDSDPDKAANQAVLDGYDNKIRLLRVDDPARSVCKNRNGNEYIGGSDPVELLPSEKSDLVLYDLVVFEPTYHSHTSHALFSASFILGTLSGGVNISLLGEYCGARPAGLMTDFDYCSVNKFNFAARATGGSL